MFIKEIKLSGFKSYKEATVLPELFNGLNIIVGRNGSGKSNIFSAIEFALTLEYNRNLKTDARQALVYHGKKDGAFVEIVFDNTDRKLPVDADTVTFRRAFSMKKDRFFVNDKELVNAKQFLDAAGFTNPYFIVKQGKVHDLALSTDAARLKVVSDVTGVNAYDQKINECKETLSAAGSRKQEIQANVNELMERKNALELEVQEMKRFLRRDQEKRAIEFVLHQRKIQEIEEKLADLETGRLESISRQKPLREGLEKIGLDKQVLNNDLAQSEGRLNQLRELKNELESSMNKIAADLAYQNQELEYLETREHTLGEERASAAGLDGEIKMNETILSKIQQDIKELKQAIDVLHFQKCRLESRVNQYREKDLAKGRTKGNGKFGNDLNQISTEISLLRQELTNKEAQKQGIEEELQKETTALKSLQDDLAQLLIRNDKIIQEVKEFQVEEQKIKSRTQVLMQMNSECELRIAQKTERSAKLNEDWKKHVGGEIYEGWENVRKILEDFLAAGIHKDIVEGYFGLVCEIIDCDSKLDTAVEIAGGRKLVHHVVQSKRVAEVILQEFNTRTYCGELNFLPVEDLTIKDMPQLSDLQGAKRFVNLIKFPDGFDSVANFVFGKSLLCKTFEIATDIMRQHKVQCVTLEGEKVSSVGVMTGGYRSRRPQKLEIQRAKNINEDELGKLTVQKQNQDRELRKLNQECHELNQKIGKHRLQKSQLQDVKRRILSDIETIERKVVAYNEEVKSVEKSIVDITASISVLEERGKLSKRKTSDTNEDVFTLTKSLRTVCDQFSDAESKFQEKQNEGNALDAKIKQLRKRYYAIIEKSSPNMETASRSDILRIKDVISAFSLQKKNLEDKLSNVNKEYRILQKEITKKSKLVDNAMARENDMKEQLMNVCNELDSFSTNQAQWLNKLAEQKAVGATLGTVPANLTNFLTMLDRELYQKLKKLKAKLKDAVNTGINKKAIQQYDELEEKCNLFKDRMEKCLQYEKELEELLVDLRAKKGEAMVRNVRLIQDQFKSIFCSIVPQGNAELIFYGQDVSIDHDTSNEEIEAAGENNFDGVRVSVNFVGKELHDARCLAQLSGGQKSVIALCLILAIQTIDPAPFYLFDEVDQALDSAYRSAVARVLGKMSERSQFICTTFRKELVDVADKVFGVSFDNRCSHIRAISEEQALNFVENDYSPVVPPSPISPNGSYSHSSSAA